MIDSKFFVKTLDEKPVAVFGLARTGLATIRALRASGATVIAWDDNETAHAKARNAGAKVKELTDEALKDCAALVLAPGVPLHFPEPHRVVLAARRMCVEIISDIEVLHRCNHGRMVIGVTGTNGKSTTTALTAHVLNACGVKSVAGGNIGHAALDLDMPPKTGALVLELSSYQLDLCPSFTPDIAIMLNITPDHTDRHGNIENYAASKERIFGGEGVAIIGVDDDYSRAMCERVTKKGERKVIPVSVLKKAPGGVYVKNNILFDDMNGKNKEIGTLANIMTLNGLHNMQNAAMAYAACRAFGLKSADILAALKTYPGLPHRQFPVRIINGVAYINDSKATNAEAAGKALACYHNIYWIIGGRAKEGGLNGLEPFMDRVPHAFVIGEAAEEFSRWLKKLGIQHTISGTLDVAVEQAHEMAQADRGQPGGAGVVLLSPACASFDQYSSYEERGDHFVKLVSKLKEKAAA